MQKVTSSPLSFSVICLAGLALLSSNSFLVSRSYKLVLCSSLFVSWNALSSITRWFCWFLDMCESNSLRTTLTLHPASRNGHSTGSSSHLLRWLFMVQICVVSPSASWCHILQCPWEIGSMWAERVGQGNVGGCSRMVQTAWPCRGLVVKSAWLGPGRSFSIFEAQMDSENSPLTLYSFHFQCSRLIFLWERVSIAQASWLSTHERVGVARITNVLKMAEWSPVCSWEDGNSTDLCLVYVLIHYKLKTDLRQLTYWKNPQCCLSFNAVIYTTFIIPLLHPPIITQYKIN